MNEEMKSLSKSMYEYVYIDNDLIFLKGWERRAKRKEIRLLTLLSCSDFEKFVDKIDKELTSIYIDDDFGESQMRGSEFATILHAEGYKKLFMASGYEAKEFAHLTWLTHTGKNCPF